MWQAKVRNNAENCKGERENNEKVKTETKHKINIVVFNYIREENERK
jgi:hypothetical protein